MTPPPFQRFLDEQRDPVWRFLVASVGRDAADDCFQETFLAAMRAYPKLRDAANLRSWALTIAHRKAIDHHRAHARRPVAVGGAPEPREHVAAPEPAGDDDMGSRSGTSAAPASRAAAALRRRPDAPRRRSGARLLRGGVTPGRP